MSTIKFAICILKARLGGEISLSDVIMCIGAIAGFCEKRAYMAFRAVFLKFSFCRIEFMFGRLTCFDMKRANGFVDLPKKSVFQG